MKIPPPLPRVSEADRKAIGEFLSTGALYSALTVPGLWLDHDTLDKVLPPEIKQQCEKCGFETRWHLREVVGCATPGSAGAGYRCKNCGADFEVWFRWRHQYSEEALRAVKDAQLEDRLLAVSGLAPTGDVEHPQGEFHFQKVGQHPAPTVNLPPELERALGKHQGLYRKAMVSRNQNFGIGALAYFRRIVEDTANNMLDLLIDALREQKADARVIKRVHAAKQEKVFEKKARIAADALPENLRPGGANPFRSLHAQFSKGIHGLTDEECVEIVDRMREDVGIIFKILKTHVEDRKTYKEAVQRIQAKKPLPNPSPGLPRRGG